MVFITYFTTVVKYEAPCDILYVEGAIQITFACLLACNEVLHCVPIYAQIGQGSATLKIKRDIFGQTRSKATKHISALE